MSRSMCWHQKVFRGPFIKGEKVRRFTFRRDFSSKACICMDCGEMMCSAEYFHKDVPVEQMFLGPKIRYIPSYLSYELTSGRI